MGRFQMGVLNIVGIGPGNDEQITPAALRAIECADHVVGYTTYIRLVQKHIKGKQITRTGMSEEIGRAKAAIELAQSGKQVTLISSGDAGVYGMAGLVFECLRQIHWKKGDSPEINILPGISAANSCGSLVGAPLIHDACTISLSDLLTPWPVIEKRIETAAQGDFVISFYNPASGRRQRQIVEAKNIIAKYRSGKTPVALVKSAYRRKQNVVLSDLDNFLDYEIGMLTTVIVGSSQTYTYEGYMVTPRGHQNKYDIDTGGIKVGQRKTLSLRCEGDIKSKIESAEKSSEEGEDLQLAKTYKTPASSWVTPKDIHDKSFLNKESLEDNAPPEKNNTPSAASISSSSSSVTSSAAAATSSASSITSSAPASSASATSSLGIVSEFCGALLYSGSSGKFLIGESKKPLDLEQNCVQVLKEQGKWKIKEINQLPTQAKPLFLWHDEGENTPLHLAQKFLIYRNNSFSRRLKDHVLENSAEILFSGKKLKDARWLSDTSQSTWDMVRETLLKC